VSAAVFVDTAYLIALLDVRDTRNREAVDLAKKLTAKSAHLTTTDAVFLEFANYFARSPLRRQAIDWITAIRGAEGWDIVPVETSLLSRAEARYRVHDDKNWSLTDCLSVEVMLARGIRDIATTDGGFTQAGFRILMP
jgi:predicted nucleic acid-binding protein